MSEIKDLKWLEGKWEGIQGSGIYHEEWLMINETELKGRAYMIKNGEFINNEKLKIHINNNELFYTAEVRHNQEPVSFKLTENSDDKFIFENPEHDFPQKITYTKINESNFIATVEANTNGKSRKILFDLKKIT